jgi:hypothetical protein
MNTFDVFGQIGKEIESFDDKILIAGKKEDNQARYLNKKEKGYLFNQKDTLDLIDFYYNSVFPTGQYDTENQRKLFLNICAFRADVASKMIDLDTKDFIFIPEEQDFKWTAYFIQREFEQWAKERYFGELINEFVEMLPKYGTIVAKRVGNDIERISLKNLVIPQNCKNLKVAKFVIEKHDDMDLEDMKKYPDWDTSNITLKFGETTTVYERYGQVPRKFYNEKKGIKGEVAENDTIECQIICTLAEKKEQDGYTGSILFMEECKREDRPYEECHWKKQDGRWLGIGEVENQFENQVARNTIANLRRRALLWSSKKIFQSPDDTVAKNLIRDVKDGEVLRIMPNGNISQVDMASRQIGEFTSAEQMWEENSNQKSFTYEVATGADTGNMPFRLGVVLSNAVNSHFGLKKEKLGLFLKKVVFEQIFEIFKRETRKEHKFLVFAGEKGMEDLKKIVAELEYSNKLIDWAMSDSTEELNFEVLKLKIEEDIKSKDILEILISDKTYDNAKVKLKLNITGEDIDVNSKVQTLTTIYQTLAQKGDPRADQVLDRIVSLTGDNLESLLGVQKQVNQMQQANPMLPQGNAPQQAQGGTMNQLASLNAPNQEQI